MAGGEGGNRIYADEGEGKDRMAVWFRGAGASLLRTSETPCHAWLSVVGLGLPAADRLLLGGIDLLVPLQVEAPLDFAVVDY